MSLCIRFACGARLVWLYRANYEPYVNRVHKRLNRSEDFKVVSDILLVEFLASILEWAIRGSWEIKTIHHRSLDELEKGVKRQHFAIPCLLEFQPVRFRYLL